MSEDTAIADAAQNQGSQDQAANTDAAPPPAPSAPSGEAAAASEQQASTEEPGAPKPQPIDSGWDPLAQPPAPAPAAPTSLVPEGSPLANLNEGIEAAKAGTASAQDIVDAFDTPDGLDELIKSLEVGALVEVNPVLSKAMARAAELLQLLARPVIHLDDSVDLAALKPGSVVTFHPYAEQVPRDLLIAKVCHEVNAAFCRAYGDFSHVPWEETSAELRESTLAGVHARLADPTVSPRTLHELWMARKLGQGWVWGPTKHAELRQHPCIRPFDELPVEQRAKDHIFGAVVASLANA